MGALPTLGWVMIAGLLLLAIPLLAGNEPHHTSREAWVWMLIAGAGNVIGLYFAYQAFRKGVLSLVAPVVATEGAVAAAIAVAAGAAVSAKVALGLVLVVAGTLLAGASGSQHGASTAGLGWALLAALSFGASLYATSRAGLVLPLAWAIAPPRILGVLFIALPLLLLGKLKTSRPALYLAWVAGCLEVAGFASYTIGARHSVTIAATLAATFGLVAAVLGRVFLSERLARRQLVGIATLTLGVLALAL